MIDTEAITEDPRTQLRRRMQQKRCLVCGARGLVNHNQSYFCAAHIHTHRFCGRCETVRPTADHGKDSRCKACAAARALAAYYADPDRSLYRIRLRQMSTRARTQGDLIMIGVRKRIALAALVRATPELSWARRGRLRGCDGDELAKDYRMQCAGLAYDADVSTRRKRGRYG